jgi:hypothetical protein
VPWLVALKNSISPSTRSLLVYNKSLEYFSLTDSNMNNGAKYSDFPADIVRLLRTDSRIVNAYTGETYEIREVYSNATIMGFGVGYGFRLKQPMKSNDYYMKEFWVIPPAIEWKYDSMAYQPYYSANHFKYTFADTQPVRSLVEKTVRF